MEKKLLLTHVPCKFLQGTAMDMLEDVNTGIAWILSRIRYYGGDPNRIHLVGQSCGAQLTMMSLLIQVGPIQIRASL